MKIAIIEDEIPARKQLVSLLHKLRPGAEVVFQGQSVRETVAYFQGQPSPDLVFMDIQLNDGLSFQVFEQVQVGAPVVFATAFDQYTLEAFQQNGIDYLLKPIKQKDLEAALMKYERFQEHFTKDISSFIRHFQGAEKGVFRKRILVKQGTGFSSVPVEEVAYFFSEHKVTFMMARDGARSIVDEPLAQLEEALDPAVFFRLNRSYLTSISAIERFFPDGKGKLNLTLAPNRGEVVTVSQEKAGDFKKWVAG